MNFATGGIGARLWMHLALWIPTYAVLYGGSGSDRSRFRFGSSTERPSFPVESSQDRRPVLFGPGRDRPVFPQESGQEKPTIRIAVIYYLVYRKLKLSDMESVLEDYPNLYRTYQIGMDYPILKLDSDSNFSPQTILKFACEEVLPRNVNMLLYMYSTDPTGKTAPLTEYLVGLTELLGIPMIAWLQDDSSGLTQTSAGSIVVQLTPSVFHQCQAMLNLLRYYNWRSFSIVTGSLAGTEFFINSLREEVEKEEEQDSFRVLSVSRIVLNEPAMIKQTLQKIRHAESRVVLFYGTRKEAEAVFKEAEDLNLLTNEFVWIVSKSVVGEGTGTFQKLPSGILGLQFVAAELDNVPMNVIHLYYDAMENIISNTPEEQRETVLFMNKSCSSNAQSIKWENGERLYRSIISRNMTIMGATSLYNKHRSPFNKDGTLEQITLSIVNLNKAHSWENIGEWSANKGIKVKDITWLHNSTTPPSGRPAKFQIKVVTLNEDPYVKYSDPDSETGKCPPMSHPCRIAPRNHTSFLNNSQSDTKDPTLYQCASGLCVDLLDRLAQEIGFEFELFQVEDGKWGAYDQEKEDWNGLVKAVRDGEADICLTSLKITPERNSQIDFSVPFLETGITIIVAVRDGKLTPTAFLKPFDLICWVFILIMCIQLLAVAVFLFEWLSPLGFNLQKLPMRREPYDFPSWCLILIFSVHICGAAIFMFEWLSPNGLNRGHKSVTEHRFSLFRSFWLIWAMLFGAAVNVDNPRGVSSRFLANIWALFAVVFTASYTANLATFMITKGDYDRLTGMDDQRLHNPNAQKPSYKFGTIPYGSTDTNIKINYPAMHKYMQPYNTRNVDEGVRMVKAGELSAFIYDASVLEFKASQDDRCMLKTVGKWSSLTGYGIGFPKKSKWLDIFNKHILKLQHDGTLERLQKFWLAGACETNSDEETKSKSIELGIPNFTSAFILLAVGMLLGGLLLLLEHAYFKFFRARLRKWDKCGCCGLISLSMGKSLTFEQSVREAIELQKHHKCKNPICETHMWKLKHELDLALLKIDRQSKMLGENGIQADDKAVWRDTRSKAFNTSSNSRYTTVTTPTYARVRRHGDNAPKTNPKCHPSTTAHCLTSFDNAGWRGGDIAYLQEPSHDYIASSTSSRDTTHDYVTSSMSSRDLVQLRDFPSARSISQIQQPQQQVHERKPMTISQYPSAFIPITRDGALEKSGGAKSKTSQSGSLGIWHSPQSRNTYKQQPVVQKPQPKRALWHQVSHMSQDSQGTSSSPESWRSQRPLASATHVEGSRHPPPLPARYTPTPRPPTLSGVVPTNAYHPEITSQSASAGYYETIQPYYTPYRRQQSTIPESSMSRSKSLPGSPFRGMMRSDMQALHTHEGYQDSPGGWRVPITRTLSFPDSQTKQRRHLEQQGRVYHTCNRSEPFIFEKETVL